MEPLRGYCCGTDITDVFLGASVMVFPCVDSLKEARSCWKECGIVEIDLSNVKVIEKITRRADDNQR